jgi:hypothetical protein
MKIFLWRALPTGRQGSRKMGTMIPVDILYGAEELKPVIEAS